MNSLPTHVRFFPAATQATVLPHSQQDKSVGMENLASPDQQALYRDLSLAVLIPAVDQDSGLGARTMGSLC
jgi:hypothetical protein